MKRRTATSAVRMLEEKARQWVATHRNELIAEHLRPYVAGIIVDARPLVDKLAAYAPDFDTDAIANKAMPAQVTAYRASRELNASLSLALEAWLSSWHAATGNGVPAGEGWAGYLRPDATGGLHVWQSPLEVDDVAVCDGRNTDVLSVATFADAGYMLRNGDDMVAIIQHQRTERPWVTGEPHSGGVLLPSDAPLPEEPATKFRAAFVRPTEPSR